jgi:RNA polymerase sigma-54 factor
MQMVLAPQLRQSLEMLQVPILELRAMVQKELELNPTLEELAPEGPALEIEHTTDEPDAPADNGEMSFDKEFEVLAKLDDEWRDYFFQDLDNRPNTVEAEEKHQFLMDSLPQHESLQEHLMQQLGLTDLDPTDRQIGELIVGSINEDGYLTVPVKELAATTGLPLDRIQNVLLAVQEFHPVGVGAADLQDCLLLQLERIGKADSVAGDIVRDHIELLASHKLDKIARLLKVSVEEVKAAAAFIATLDPTPGRAFSDNTSAYIFPEVVVRKVEGEYVVILNDDRLPHLRISRHYRDLMEAEDTPPDVKTYIRNKLRSSTFLLKSIDQRQRTIYRIASEIVKQQTDFLEHGVSQLRPLTMSAVAEQVGVHETTVSRAVNQKYMRTPLGTFEMKYFFNPGLRTSSGESISNKTVKDIIVSIVAEEDSSAPLSDITIMDVLKQRGITVARRTVAKYRDMSGIPPAHLRKRN